MIGGARRWAIVVHGGAKEISPEEERANIEGCRAALAAGEEILRQGGTALEAVEAALRELESDPTFNADILGAEPNADGAIALDAALMDGRTLDIGAVAALEGIAHPISAARLVLREPPVLLVGEGARRYVLDRGAEPWTLPMGDRASSPRANGKGHDTVGCVALDMHGDLAAGTSTGGLDGSPPGRVGDSPMPGCGYYADNALGATVFSGDGEDIARAMLAARVMERLGTQDPQAAVEHAIAQLGRVGGEAGGLVLDRLGRIGWAHNSSHFAVAYAVDGMDGARVYLKKSDERERSHG